MRRTTQGKGFFLCLLVNMLMNLEGPLAAAVLIALHRWLRWPLWIALAVLGVWILCMLMWTLLIGYAGKCGSERTPPRENKNPYSVKEEPYGQKL